MNKGMGSNEDWRANDEQKRRGEYLLAGHTPETQLAVLTRDVEYLIERVRDAEDRNKELEKRQDSLEKALGNLIIRGSTLFALVVALGVFLGWLASFMNNAKNLISGH